METFGGIVKQSRIDRDLSIFQVARYIGVNTRVLNDIEENIMRPEWYRVEALCDFFYLDYNYIESLIEGRNTIKEVISVDIRDKHEKPPEPEPEVVLVQEPEVIEEDIVELAVPEPEVLDTFGKIIKSIRIHRDLTGVAVSKDLGIGKSTLSDYEFDKTKPGEANLATICGYYDLDIEEMNVLLGREPVVSDSEGEDISNMTLGEILKRERTKKKVSQAVVGVTVGVHKSTIGNYEADKAVPPRDILVKICKYYKMDINALAPVINKPFGTLMKLEREKNDEPLSIASKILNISEAVLVEYEENQSKPSMDRLKNICYYYDLDVAKMIEILNYK